MWGGRIKKRRKKRSAAITYSQNVKTAALVLLMTAGIALHCLFQNPFATRPTPACLSLSGYLSSSLSLPTSVPIRYQCSFNIILCIHLSLSLPASYPLLPHSVHNSYCNSYLMILNNGTILKAHTYNGEFYSSSFSSLAYATLAFHRVSAKMGAEVTFALA